MSSLDFLAFENQLAPQDPNSSQTSSTLCQNCLEIFQQWKSSGHAPSASNYFRHPHLTTVDLIRSAKSCHMCFLLLEPDYKIEDDENLDSRINRIRIYNLSTGAYSMTLREMSAGQAGDSAFSRTLYGQTISQEEADRLVNRIGYHTGRVSYKLLAKSWFDNCLSTHKSCKIAVQDYLLPTRLIDIETRRDKPRLVPSTDLPSNIPYATLSHCWGELKITTLQKKNLKEFQEHIPMRKLCKTFRESFDTARQFGLCYIWIDSLCIIQDDEADWARESLLMSQVYGFSKLNIAAAGAKDGRKGLFFRRNPLLVQKFRTTVQPSSTEELPVTIEWSLSRLQAKCVQLSPLGYRAWAFQERFLAPRTLHFGNPQLFWECKEVQACETYPDMLPPLNFLEKFESAVDISIVDDSMTLEQAWSYIVAGFGRARLTKSDDKLVALSGIAKLIAKRYGATYLCGLWKENLVDQLLWVSRTSMGRPDSYRAPSWSWASVDGYIAFSYFVLAGCRCSRVTSVVDVEVTPRGLSIYGQIKAGFVRLNCLPLIPYNFDMSSLGVVPRDIWSYMDAEQGLTSGNVTLLHDNCYYLRFLEGHDPGRINGLIVQAT